MSDDHDHSHEDHGHSHDDHDHGEPGTHDHHHHDRDELGVAVLTISSSRSLDDDAAGDQIADALENAGHQVTTRDLVPDDYDKVQSTVQRFVDRKDTEAVITTGGTGVTPDDVTVEAVRPLLKKELPGFGELFRRRSYEEIGTMVVATRATAGVADGVPIFCLPGSENAAALGAELILSTAGHLVGLASRDDDGHDHDDHRHDHGAHDHDGHQHDEDGHDPHEHGESGDEGADGGEDGGN
ncbi:MogA/MoaB family molybdenum cofactor biosynthesis protein [Halolamina salifodinae]|uniref:Molybdenum cofactor biosynthesis protein B n=1 Tax=Halolamina salifodinae TaxID=1202767 RepID=A0A8T4H519_9EURY|nr:MogA/MoaB family molybdenum cofactor biosynthesis protein [Halolamina salifodinae]MBP1988218.1 molybdenum cofactor biosynthesis protein B [Halolamina salifodinae]